MLKTQVCRVKSQNSSSCPTPRPPQIGPAVADHGLPELGAGLSRGATEDAFLEDRNGKVSFSDSRHSGEQQTAIAALARRKGVDHARGTGHAALQRVVVRLEIRQRAVLVAARNVCRRQALAAGFLAPAAAALDAADAVAVDGLPSCVVTKRAGHRSGSVEVRPQPLRAAEFFLRPRFDLADALARQVQPLADLL